MIPANYAQIGLHFGIENAPRDAWVIHGVADVIPTNSPSEIFDALLPCLEDKWPTDLSDACTLFEVKIKCGPDDTGPFGLFPCTIGGTRAGEVEAPQQSALVTKNTTHGGRKGRGRMYLPGIGIGETSTGGLLVSSFRTALQADLDIYIDDLAAADIPMVVLHADATSPYLVDSLTVQSLTATQRRRLRK